MSTSLTATEAQQVSTYLTQNLSALFQAIKKNLYEENKQALLNLKPQALALFLSQLSQNNRLPLLAIINASRREQAQLQTTMTAWHHGSSISQDWHILEPLTEQELSGAIITPPSIAWHMFLSKPSAEHNFIASPELFASPIPDKTKYQQTSLSLTVAETISMQTITNQLVKAGYIRQHTSLEPGAFKVTGEIIDIMHPALSGIYRLTFHGSRIERIIHTLDRRSRDQASMVVPPIILTLAPGTEKIHIPTHTIIAPEEIAIEEPHIIYNSLRPDHEFPWHEKKELRPTSDAHLTTFFFYENFDHAKQLAKAHAIETSSLIAHPLGAIPLLLEEASTRFISEKFLRPKQIASTPVSLERARELIGELTVGKPAVHADHGIGMFEGMETRTIEKQAREYLIIRYAEGDVLSVPVEYAYKVTAYIGEKTPAIHRLHGSTWAKTKRKAQHDAIAFAKELLIVAQKRSAHRRTPYSLTAMAEEAIAKSFPYTLTPDQARAWEEVRQDLMQDIPTDRLIVGDVGFGKTELALRAAYHAIQNGRQVAVLAPTTLLVQQHMDTFTARFTNDQHRIGMLSRFTTPAAEKKTRAQLADGSMMIGIGTHALLSSRTQWHNLGLVIIDEEQRFGVKHKEHFKKIRAEVDVISLSATPIPRTLSMALSGLRNLSIIATPPLDRKDVITRVAKMDDSLLTESIERELKRQGQVYIVAPKIRHLASIREHIHQLFPHARLGIAHGQMPDEALSKIIHEFDQGTIDILISSTIVENGLDLPHANTMIVWHAPHMGLADLYQLRGRIGRRATQGYAYFLYNQTELTPIQKQRLAALTEASRLGSGWLIAQRDLEIRGAGNLLGAEQSGTVTTVGVQLYMDMIQQAMEEEVVPDVAIELSLPALLPPHYIADTKERTRWYVRLTRAKTQDLPHYIATLEASFGTLPPEVTNLIRLVRLQKAAAKAGIASISSQKITPSDEYPYERLEIKAHKLPEVLQRLQTLGNWRVRHDKATLDIDKIDEPFIDKLIKSLS